MQYTREHKTFRDKPQSVITFPHILGDFGYKFELILDHQISLVCEKEVNRSDLIIGLRSMYDKKKVFVQKLTDNNSPLDCGEFELEFNPQSTTLIETNHGEVFLDSVILQGMLRLFIIDYNSQMSWEIKAFSYPEIGTRFIVNGHMDS